MLLPRIRARPSEDTDCSLHRPGEATPAVFSRKASLLVCCGSETVHPIFAPEAKAEKTLRDTDTFRVPVAIDMVAQRLNLTMEAGALGDDVSGMLIIRGERGAIGYNSGHARVRQRFTISHEIAHFLLHAKRGGKPQLFIDRYVAFRRDASSSAGVDRDEVEANQLGAALLMPQRLVQQEIRNNELDLDDEDAISFLAKRFQVSSAAMANRLANLGILR